MCKAISMITMLITLLAFQNCGGMDTKKLSSKNDNQSNQTNQVNQEEQGSTGNQTQQQQQQQNLVTPPPLVQQPKVCFVEGRLNSFRTINSTTAYLTLTHLVFASRPTSECDFLEKGKSMRGTIANLDEFESNALKVDSAVRGWVSAALDNGGRHYVDIESITYKTTGDNKPTLINPFDAKNLTITSPQGALYSFDISGQVIKVLSANRKTCTGIELKKTDAQRLFSLIQESEFYTRPTSENVALVKVDYKMGQSRSYFIELKTRNNLLDQIMQLSDTSRDLQFDCRN